jgi:hypothetical protein
MAHVQKNTRPFVCFRGSRYVWNTQHRNGHVFDSPICFLCKQNKTKDKWLIITPPGVGTFSAPAAVQGMKKNTNTVFGSLYNVVGICKE